MLKPYSELVKVDVTKYCKKRDGMDYLNWAKCVELLHEHGAETVYFEPMVNEHGSSLFMSDQVFGSGKEGDPTNRCYEVGVTVHVDDNTWEFRGPLMNGKNPVKDNSLTQQRVWNAQTRLFVKCIAIHTGLGFHLWVKSEENEQDVWTSSRRTRTSIRCWSSKRESRNSLRPKCSKLVLLWTI